MKTLEWQYHTLLQTTPLNSIGNLVEVLSTEAWCLGF